MTAEAQAVVRHQQFTCSPAELQDLLARTTDATRAALDIAKTK